MIGLEAAGPDWLSSIAGLGVGAIVVAIVNGLLNKRKLSAEATKIITDAASGVVERLEQENARIGANNTILSGRVDAQQIQLDQMRSEQRALGEAVVIHAYWDSQAVEVAREHGIDLPPPPPLTTGS